MTQQECSDGSDTQDPERLNGFSEQQHLLEQISRELDEYFSMKLSLRTDNLETGKEVRKKKNYQELVSKNG